MDPQLFIPLSVTMGLITWGLAATWWAVPALARLPKERAALPLILPHGLRYVGLAFLVPGLSAQPLPEVFSHPAAYGDLIAAVLALVAAISLRRNWPAAIGLVWAFNIFGFADLLNALYRGMGNMSIDAAGAAFYIPALAVPPLLVTHVVLFWVLVRGRDS